jgi:ribosomal-protein-alanine N-acetyltransferase
MESIEKVPKKEDIPVVLQRATSSDVKELLEIEKTTIGQKTYSGYYTEEEIAKYIESDIVYLIKNNNEIAGSISYEIKDKNHAYISGLVIKPEFQKMGLAKKAAAELLEELKDYQKVDLAVHPKNSNAVSLYKSLGFVGIETKENFYGDGEPRLMMEFEKSV